MPKRQLESEKSPLSQILAALSSPAFTLLKIFLGTEFHKYYNSILLFTWLKQKLVSIKINNFLVSDNFGKHFWSIVFLLFSLIFSLNRSERVDSEDSIWQNFYDECEAIQSPL